MQPSPSPARVDAASDGVLFLHGIARRASSMNRLEGAFRDAGFATLNLDYPARRATIEALAEMIAPRVASFAATIGRLHMPVDFPFGVIAGTRTLDPIASWTMLPGPDDVLPDLRSMPGCILLLSFVLYPYVYLPTRALFLMQAGGLVEAARTLLLRPLNVETLATYLYGEAAHGTYEDGTVAALLIVLVGLAPVAVLLRLDAPVRARTGDTALTHPVSPP